MCQCRVSMLYWCDSTCHTDKCRTSNTSSNWSVDAIEFVHTTKWKQDRIVFRATHHCQFPNSQLYFLKDKKNYLKLNKIPKNIQTQIHKGLLSEDSFISDKQNKTKAYTSNNIFLAPLQKRYYDKQTSHIVMQELSK